MTFNTGTCSRAECLKFGHSRNCPSAQSTPVRGWKGLNLAVRGDAEVGRGSGSAFERKLAGAMETEVQPVCLVMTESGTGAFEAIHASFQRRNVCFQHPHPLVELGK